MILKTLTFDPLICNYLIAGVVVLLPCTGSIKGWTQPNFYQSSPHPSGLKLCETLLVHPRSFLALLPLNEVPIHCAPLQLCVGGNSLVVDSLLVVDGIWLYLWIPFVCSIAACMLPSTSFCLCFSLERNP